VGGIDVQVPYMITSGVKSVRDMYVFTAAPKPSDDCW